MHTTTAVCESNRNDLHLRCEVVYSSVILASARYTGLELDVDWFVSVISGVRKRHKGKLRGEATVSFISWGRRTPAESNWSFRKGVVVLDSDFGGHYRELRVVREPHLDLECLRVLLNGVVTEGDTYLER